MIEESLKSSGLNTGYYQTNKKRFSELIDSFGLIKGGIYFVAESNSFNHSNTGIIYVATSASTAVRFGSFSKYDDIDEIINQINQKLDTKTETKEYPTASQFPESGLPNTLYIDTSTGATYRWDGEQYAVMGGYTAGYGIEITSGGEIKAEPLTDAEIEAICV